MEEISISKFKATCLAVLDGVQRTGNSVLVTRFGHPVAVVGPSRAARVRKRALGRMAGTGRVLGDLIAPASEPGEWDALR